MSLSKSASLLAFAKSMLIYSMYAHIKGLCHGELNVKL